MYDYLPISNNFLEHVNYIIKKNAINIVQTEMLRMASLVYSIPSNVRSVFVHHELGYIRNTQYLMKNNKIGKFITIFSIIMVTIEIGIGISYYMLINIDFDKYNNDYKIVVVK